MREICHSMSVWPCPVVSCVLTCNGKQTKVDKVDFLLSSANRVAHVTLQGMRLVPSVCTVSLYGLMELD